MNDIAKIIVDIEVTGTKEAADNLHQLKQVGQDMEASRYNATQGWLDNQLNSNDRFYQELASSIAYFEQVNQESGQLFTQQIDTNLEKMTAAQAEINEIYTGFDESVRRGAKRLDNMGFELFKSWIVEGKSALDGLKNFFKNWLAEMAYAATARPIIMQISAAVTGMVGGGSGLAYAGDQLIGGGLGGVGGGGGLGGNFSSLSSLIPDSWSSSLSGIMSYNLPGTGVTYSLPSGMAGPVGVSGGGGLSLGAATGYGAIGALGYGTLGKMIGLPQGKWSGLGAGLGGTLGAWGGGALAGSLASAATGAASGAAAGAAAGSWLPGIGTAIGAIIGGVLASQIGVGKKTKPSVYSGISNMSLTEGWDYAKFFEAGAWYDRTDPEQGQEIFQGLGQIAETSVNSILGLAKSLPDEYSQEVLTRMSQQTWSAGRNSPGSTGTWNFQEKDLEATLTHASLDIQANILAAFQRSLAGMDLSKLGVDIDATNFAGIEKAMQGLSTIKEVETVIQSTLNPMSEMEAITAQVNVQFDIYKKQLEALGVQAWKIAEIEANRTAVLEKALEPMRKAFDQDHELRYAQLTQTEAQANQLSLSIQQSNELTEAIKKFGESSAQVALLTALQAEEMAAYIKQVIEANAKYIKETLALRQAQIDGDENAIAMMRLMINHEQELAEARQRFGSENPFIGQLQWIQAQEKYQLELAQYQATMAKYQAEVEARNAEAERLRREYEQAKSAFFAELQAEQSRLQQDANKTKTEFYNALQAEQNRLQAQVDSSKAALIAGLEKEKNRLETLIATSRRFAESMKNLQQALWTDNKLSILNPAEQNSVAENNLQQLYEQAMQGDQTAYSKFEAATKEYLQKSIEANASFEAYQADFLRVQNMISNLAEKNGNSLSLEEQQLEAIKKELETFQNVEKTLDELRADYAKSQTYLEDFNAKYFNYLSEINNSQLKSLEALQAAMIAADNRLAAFNNQYSVYIGQIGTSVVNKLEELKAAYLKAAADLKDELAKPPVTKPDVIEPIKPEPPIPPELLPPTQKPDLPKTMLEILDAKAAAMNRGETLAPDQVAGGWTASKVLELIYGRGYTFERWYEEFGKLEGFAKGGLPSVGAWSLVGEEGPELVNFSQPTRVYTAKDTLTMLNQTAQPINSQADFTQAIQDLKLENRELRLQLSQILSSINNNTRRISDTVEAWDMEGQPEVRLQ